MKGTLLAAALAILLVGCGFKTIDTGNVGIPVTFGKVTGAPVTEGFNTYNPFTSSLVEMDTHVLKFDNKTKAYTKDVQEANVEYVLNYQLRKDKAADVYQQFGQNWDNALIPQIVQGTLKEVIGQWDAVDLIQHRADAGIEVTKRITAALATKFINVNSFEITDLQYSGAFNKSIEDKVIAQQSAIREQNHTVEVQQLANQQVIQATAEAKSMQIRAEALSQNPKLVEWEAVQKWNGELPTQMFGGTVPFINVSTGQK